MAFQISTPTNGLESGECTLQRQGLVENDSCTEWTHFASTLLFTAALASTPQLLLFLRNWKWDVLQGQASQHLVAGWETHTNSTDGRQSPHLHPQCGYLICSAAQTGREQVESGTHMSAFPLEKEGETVGSDCVQVCVCVRRYVSVCELMKWNSDLFFICIQMTLSSLYYYLDDGYLSPLYFSYSFVCFSLYGRTHGKWKFPG